MKYRKRPLVIEAVQMPSHTGDERFDSVSLAAGPQWLHHALGVGTILADGVGGWHVNTLEGKITASPGDYIIRGIKGELYPCKPDIFEATYEEAAAIARTISQSP